MMNLHLELRLYSLIVERCRLLFARAAAGHCMTAAHTAADHMTVARTAADHMTVARTAADQMTAARTAADHMTVARIAADHMTVARIAADHMTAVQNCRVLLLHRLLGCNYWHFDLHSPIDPIHVARTAHWPVGLHKLCSMNRLPPGQH